jgi:transposase
LEDDGLSFLASYQFTELYGRNLDREAYRRRNAVERCVNRLKQWRGIATRYEKRAVNYRAAVVVIASLMMWLPS